MVTRKSSRAHVNARTSTDKREMCELLYYYFFSFSNGVVFFIENTKRRRLEITKNYKTPPGYFRNIKFLLGDDFPHFLSPSPLQSSSSSSSFLSLSHERIDNKSDIITSNSPVITSYASDRRPPITDFGRVTGFK